MLETIILKGKLVALATMIKDDMEIPKHMADAVAEAYALISEYDAKCSALSSTLSAMSKDLLIADMKIKKLEDEKRD